MPEEKTKEKDHGETFFTWKFSEFPQYQRDKSWYVRAGVIVFALLIFAVLNPHFSFMRPHVTFSSPNFMFALLIILSSLIVLLFQRSLSVIEFKITEDGILVNKKFYEYKEIKNFYIIYEPPDIKTLYFEPKSIFSPRLPIPLEDQNPVEVREVLRKYLEEDLDREDEPVSDQVSRTFKL